MKEAQGRYASYLLRLWQTARSGKLAFRASLEDAGSGHRVGFADLDDLCDYLRLQADLVPEANSDANGDQEGRQPGRR